jgi:hypothetical protein
VEVQAVESRAQLCAIDKATAVPVQSVEQVDQSKLLVLNDVKQAVDCSVLTMRFPPLFNQGWIFGFL